MTRVSSEGAPLHLDPDEEPCPDFEEFYRSTVHRTRRAVRSLAGDDYIAQEAVQEAYFRMLKLWPQRNTVLLGANWRYTVVTARNVVLDGFRRDRRWAELDEDLQIGEDDPNLIAVLDEMSLMRAVRALLDSWPPRRRAVAIMHILQGRDYAEIAKHLTLTQSAVRSHVGDARELLRPYLQRMAKLDAEKGGRSS